MWIKWGEDYKDYNAKELQGKIRNMILKLYWASLKIKFLLFKVWNIIHFKCLKLYFSVDFAAGNSKSFAQLYSNWRDCLGDKDPVGNHTLSPYNVSYKRVERLSIIDYLSRDDRVDWQSTSTSWLYIISLMTVIYYKNKTKQLFQLPWRTDGHKENGAGVIHVYYTHKLSF